MLKVDFHLSVWLQEREREQENGKGKNKYLIFNQDTVTCAKIALQFYWLLKNNKSAVFAKITLFDWLS